jgi:hypothetical protein
MRAAVGQFQCARGLNSINITAAPPEHTAWKSRGFLDSGRPRGKGVGGVTVRAFLSLAIVRDAGL